MIYILVIFIVLLLIRMLGPKAVVALVIAVLSILTAGVSLYMLANFIVSV